jgi:hypothetical protein
VTDGKIKLKATKLSDQITAICCIVCSRVSERPTPSSSATLLAWKVSRDGYRHISAAAWRAWDEAVARWQVERRAVLSAVAKVKGVASRER